MGIEIIDDFKTKERLLREDFLYRGETRTPLTEQTGTWGLTGKESDVLDFQEQRTLTPLVPACPLGILSDLLRYPTRTRTGLFPDTR